MEPQADLDRSPTRRRREFRLTGRMAAAIGGAGIASGVAVAMVVQLLAGGSALSNRVAGASSSPNPLTIAGTSADPSAAASAAASPSASAVPSQAATASPRSPAPSAKPTPIPEPPKPSGVSFDEHVTGDPDDYATVTQTVRWKAPRTKGVEIRVYGVTACLAMPANPTPGSSGPCLVEHTPLPESVRTLLATAPASAGAASWTWSGTFGCGEPNPGYDPKGPAYFAVVLAAYSASGHSIFAIAEPGGWWEPLPGDVIC
jgi:hypothetical protein